MKKIFHFQIILLLFSFSACRQTTKNTPPQLAGLPVPCQSGGMPNLHVTATGKALLSWIEFLNDTTDALVFSSLKNDGWGPPQTFATGSDWFVNWADFPAIVARSDDEKSLAAHWLQKSAGGTYDYDIRVVQSADGGSTWGNPFTLHRDGVEAEHGFVSLLPLPDGRIFATWLDGRFTKTEKAESRENGHEHGHAGAMTLRCAAFDKTGWLTDEAELDNKVCDCCQTAAALTSKGVIVAYRNRSDEENRDIFYTRQKDGGWSPSKAIFADNWHITGCPVNGPALAADGETVALAWFTAANEKPEVKVTLSTDAGDSFGLPVRLDSGTPAGRVDVILLSKKKALVCWLENVGEVAEIRAIEVDVNGQKGRPFLVAQTSAARSSGFPRMERVGDKVVFAWTEVIGEGTSVRSAWVEF